MSFTHIDANGDAVMVDVSDKKISKRKATATGKIYMSRSCFTAVVNRKAKKGDVLTVAEVAGTMAAKRTSELIPLCHNIALTNSTVTFSADEKHHCFEAVCTVSCEGKTGVEMEALNGVSTALLTVYDMCKALDKTMQITGIYLLEKEGGKSGHYICDKEGDGYA